MRKQLGRGAIGPSKPGSADVCSSSSSSGSVSSVNSNHSSPHATKDVQSRSNSSRPGLPKSYKQHQYKEGRFKTSARENSEILSENGVEDQREVKGFNQRKSNLSHLLNFHFSDLEDYDARGNNSYSFRYWNTRSSASIYPAFDKYKFIHANCKFVIREDSKFVYSSPDSLADWDIILQIQLVCDDVPECPICLEVPTAPKMTKCGHVFCFPCALHLLELSEKSWAKCPICFDAVKESDLKNVKALKQKKFDIGDNISLNLMSRNKNSVQVVPIKLLTSEEGPKGEKDNAYEKFTRCSHATEYDSILVPMKNSLLEAFQRSEDVEEAKYVQMAIDKLEAYVKNLPKPRVHAEKESEDADGGIVFNAGEQQSSSDDNRYLFYQSEDGQHIFVAPFNIKCLLKQYGQLEKCPEMISGQISELRECRVDEAFRKKHRFLAHLPLGSLATFVELDLRPPFVSRYTMKFFADELREKKEAKERKRREERKREGRIARHNQQHFYSGFGDDVTCMNIGLGEDHFPSFTSENVEASALLNHEDILEYETSNDSPVPATQRSSDSSNAHLEETATGSCNEPIEGAWAGASGSSSDIVPIGSGKPFTSFANVLMSPSSPPSTSTGGWVPATPWGNYGQRVAQATEVDQGYSRKFGGLQDSDEVGIDLPAPEYTLEHAFSHALDRAFSGDSAVNDSPIADKSGGKKGKKKTGKKILLFSNSFRPPAN